MLVMALVFVGLYQGGIRVLRDTFISRIPPQVVEPTSVNIVTLHPVEALIFEVKVSVIAGAVATVPILLYWAWPAMRERGLVRGDRNMLFGWAGVMFATLTVGSVVGFLYIAPYIISALVWDAIRANMIIDFRINSFGWLVFFTTVGVGLLSCVPVTMLMFHRRGLIPYRVMRDRWRVPVIASLVLGMLASPKGVFTMFLLGIPIAASYGLGLAVLWLYTRVRGVDPPGRGRAVTDD
jgi:sec-independent protein translocase protein TatC